MASNILYGVGGFAGGAAVGLLAAKYVPSLLGAGSFAVALIDTSSPQGTPGLVAGSYTYPSGSTVQVTVFAASSNPSVTPTTVTGYYSPTGSGGFKPSESFTWNVGETGYAFTFNYGEITGPAQVYVYYVVRFSDGSTAKTNILHVEVA